MGPVAWLMMALLIGGLVLGAAAVGVTYSLVRAALQTPKSERKAEHGDLALARLLTSRYPELEVISVDLANNRVTLRDRKSGKVATQDIESARNGEFHFAEQSQPLAQRAGSTPPGAPDSAGEKPLRLPDWIPSYPFSQPRGETPQPDAGSFRFETRDSVSEVLSFYQEALKQEGFQITAVGTDSEAPGVRGSLTAIDAHANRSVTIEISAGASASRVAVRYAAK